MLDVGCFLRALCAVKDVGARLSVNPSGATGSPVDEH